MPVLDDLLWRLACRLNRPIPWRAAAPAPAEFASLGGGVDVLAGARLDAPELCVVVTTHARVGACDALLRALAASLREASLLDRAFVLVLEDRSDHDYSPVLHTLGREFAGRFAFYRSSVWLRKPGRWFVYQRALDAVRALAPAHTLFLEDDAVFEPSFVREALAAWRAIEDPDKAVLYLCSFADDEEAGRWIAFRRRLLPGGRARLTQWFDLHAFLVDARFFECLGHRMLIPSPARWRGRPSRSSGVSEQFTRRLFGRMNVYQVVETLARHGGIPSVLNEDARKARPLDNTARSDP